MYINDIYKSDPITAFHLFANDTALFFVNKNIDQLKIEGVLTFQYLGDVIGESGGCVCAHITAALHHYQLW